MRPWFVILKQVQDDERVALFRNYVDKCVMPFTTPFKQKTPSHQRRLVPIACV
jgi:hypothetical protein